MKEQTISKINSLGNVGFVLTVIAKVLIVIAMAACFAASIFFLAMPKDFLTLSISGNAKARINLSSVGKTLSEKEQADITKNFDGSGFELDNSTYEFSTVTADSDGFTAGGESGVLSLSFRKFAVLTIMGFLYSAAVFAALIFLGKLCTQLKNCRTPFEESVITSLTRFSWSLIPTAVLSIVSTGIYKGFFSGNYSFSLDFTIVAAVLIVLALVQIFKYGAILQQESDETL